MVIDFNIIIWEIKIFFIARGVPVLAEREGGSTPSQGSHAAVSPFSMSPSCQDLWNAPTSNRYVSEASGAPIKTDQLCWDLALFNY